MQKTVLWVAIVVLLALPLVAASETILDAVPSGSISTWTQQYSAGNSVVANEITSPYDGSTALKQSISGNTYESCPVQYLTKVYDVGNANTLTSSLSAYMAFSYTGEYYNFPFVQVNLMDSTDQVVGYKIFYPNLEGINTGYWYNQYIVSNPTLYGELPSDAGFYTMDFSSLGSIDYSKVRVYIGNYVCVGSNTVVFDQLVFDNGWVDDGYSVPEFGLIGAGLVLIGAIVTVSVSRKNG